MRVFHLISGGETGGSRVHVLSLVQELQKQIEITLVCLMAEGFYQEALERGLPVKTIAQKKRYDLGVIKELRGMISGGNYELLHCHGARANFYGVFLKRLIKIPVVTTIHSDYKQDFIGSFYKKLVYTTLNTWALRSFDSFVAVSDNFKELLVSRGFPAEKIFVVYNGIDFGLSLKLASRQDFLQKFALSIPPEAKIVGIVARLHPIKGLDLFIRGAQHILKEEPETHFIIAGEGKEREKLEYCRESLKLQKKVHFIGHIKNTDEFINILDINTLTSHSESFPYVLLEGARLKKPTVSSDVGGIGRLIKEKETGLLFRSGDETDFATKVLELLRGRDLATRMGERLYQHSQKNFSLKRLAESHLHIYNFCN